MEEVRIDKWLWATRVFKTRTIAADACKKGRVMINNVTVKLNLAADGQHAVHVAVQHRARLTRPPCRVRNPTLVPLERVPAGVRYLHARLIHMRRQRNRLPHVVDGLVRCRDLDVITVVRLLHDGHRGAYLVDVYLAPVRLQSAREGYAVVVVVAYRGQVLLHPDGR